jgi:hypothetical protein
LDEVMVDLIVGVPCVCPVNIKASDLGLWIHLPG